VTDMRDELLERIVDELRTLPPADEAAVRRIVTAASEDENAMAAAGETGRSRFAVRAARWLHSRVPLAAAAGIALGAGLTGYAVRGDRSLTPVAAAVRTPADSFLVATADRISDHVPTQFVLDAPRASQVALVGDFNAWDAADTPLMRDPASGIWTVTVRLVPGRHTYAFMVDGATWTLDPRAPSAQDPDFGTPSSVVLVGTP
jgi:Glycogen recognition site of AMP-activated protein kinase